MLRWLEHEPRFDVVTLPFTLLISLARPLREALGAADRLHAAGRGSVSREPARAVEVAGAGSDPRAVGDVDVFIAVSDYYARLHVAVPRHSARVAFAIVPIGITSTAIGRSRRARRRRTRSASSRGSRRRRACTCWPRRTGGCVAKPGVPPTRLLAGGYLLDEHRDYLAAIEQRMREWGLADRVPLRRRAGSRRQDRAAAGDGRDLHAGRPTTSRRGSRCSRRWPTACPSCSRDRGAFPEIVAAHRRRPAGDAGRSRRARRRAARAPHRSRARGGARPGRRRRRAALSQRGRDGDGSRTSRSRLANDGRSADLERPVYRRTWTR